MYRQILNERFMWFYDHQLPFARIELDGFSRFLSLSHIISMIIIIKIIKWLYGASAISTHQFYLCYFNYSKQCTQWTQWTGIEYQLIQLSIVNVRAFKWAKIPSYYLFFFFFFDPDPMHSAPFSLYPNKEKPHNFRAKKREKIIEIEENCRKVS